MKTISKKWALPGIAVVTVGLIVVAPVSAAFGYGSTDVTSVESAPIAGTGTPISTVDAFHAALKRGDTKAALGYLSEDVVIFESGAVESSRAEYETHHLEADAEFSASTSRIPVSAVIQEDDGMAAVMRVELVRGSFRGRPINSRSVETMLLRKINGQWRIAHIHWSSADLKK